MESQLDVIETSLPLVLTPGLTVSRLRQVVLVVEVTKDEIQNVIGVVHTQETRIAGLEAERDGKRFDFTYK